MRVAALVNWLFFSLNTLNTLNTLSFLITHKQAALTKREHRLWRCLSLIYLLIRHLRNRGGVKLNIIFFILASGRPIRRIYSISATKLLHFFHITKYLGKNLLKECVFICISAIFLVPSTSSPMKCLYSPFPCYGFPD